MNHDVQRSGSQPSPPQDVSQLSLLDLFCLEVNTQITVFNHELLNLELTQNREEALAALMRAAHSIKGAARIVQVEAGVAIAHELEEYFVAAQAGKVIPTTDHVDVLLAGGDVLLAIAHDLEANQVPIAVDAPTIQAYLQSLKAILQDDSPAIEPIVQATVIDPVAHPAIDPVRQNESLTPEVLDLGCEISPAGQAIPTVTPIAPPQNTATPPMAVPDRLPVAPEATSPKAKLPSHNRTVRLSAEHLHRLMDLAGESLVAANGLQHFSDSFMRLKKQQTELNRLLAEVKGTIALSQTIRTNPGQSSYTAVAVQEKLTLACQKANECQQLLLNRQGDFEVFSQKSNQLADRLYREVVASQMRPLSDIGQGFPRMVRDLAKQLGKQVQLVVSGQQTLVDRDILDRLETPLTHLLRNAIDHAIESPEQRQRWGKPPHGTLYLEASHRAGVLLITVRDDGCGIDCEQLRQRIVQKQLTTATMAAAMTETELLEFLYLPGFSTAPSVTEISGRGVGLDIVRNMVQSVGGSLRTTSQLGQGSTFHLQLPLTLSVMRTLVVQIAGDPYAIGLSRVDRIITIKANQIMFSESRPYMIDHQQTIGLLSAAAVIGLPTPKEIQDELTLIVLHDRTHHYGLIIDRVLGEQSLVVRALDQRLGKVPNISAAALLNDGTPLLIMDADDLLRSLEKQLVQGGSTQALSPMVNATPIIAPKRILVVDDSITVREMERKLLENAGYKVDVAVDGMDGWNMARMGQYELIVTDVDMPRLSGIELVHQLKAHATLQAIPTIIISYKDREVDRIAGLEAGADYYLTKSSFHDDTLLQAVIDLIGQATDRANSNSILDRQ
jgi:two-component system, chemotaxis family, sensor histidine kinase and response regulator WspE